MLKVVILSASWCHSCKSLKKSLAKLQESHPDLVYEEQDVEANTDLVERYRIQAVPLIVFRDADGRDVQIIEGAIPASKVLEIAQGV